MLLHFAEIGSETKKDAFPSEPPCHADTHRPPMQPEPVQSLLMNAFFVPQARMKATIAILCDCHAVPPPDPVTHTVLTMLSCPLQMQLTAIGWQPFKGKDLTMPYHRMTCEQREVIKGILLDETRRSQWGVFEHALVIHDGRRCDSAPPSKLPVLDILEATCSTILQSQAYPDRRSRVAICNIVLQRVQSNIAVDKGVLRDLNQRLFHSETPASSAQ